MKSIHRILLQQALLLALPLCNGFQFMSGWKMPTYDPHEEAIQERFGNKSKSSFVKESFYVVMYLLLSKKDLSIYHLA
jgi:hypothetical protein